jgi:hypothetical protein
MLLDVYFLFLTVVAVTFSMPVLCTKQIAAKERKIRAELKMVESLDFDSFPQ